MNRAVPGSRPCRDRLRAGPAGAGAAGLCLAKQVAAALAGQGMQTRPGCRYPGELSRRLTATRSSEHEQRASMLPSTLNSRPRTADV